MPQGHYVNLRAGPLQRSQRNGELDFLEAVGRQGGNLAALESASGEHLVLLPPDGTVEIAHAPSWGSLEQGANNGELAPPTCRGYPRPSAVHLQRLAPQ